MADTFEVIKGSELALATQLLRDEKFIVVQDGTTKQLGIEYLSELLTQASYIEDTFSDSDVIEVSGTGWILNLNHGLNTTRVVAFIKNPAGENQWLAWSTIDANNVRINFGGPVEAGTWSYILLHWSAGSSFNEQTLFKTINIGPWNILANQTKSIDHGLDYTKIVSITGIIFGNYVTVIAGVNHTNVRRIVIPGLIASEFTAAMRIEYNATRILVTRNVTSDWNEVQGDFEETTNDRGILHITYTP